jgi:hypothetical protein
MPESNTPIGFCRVIFYSSIIEVASKLFSLSNGKKKKNIEHG